MNDSDLYIMLLWLSGFVAGLALCCALMVIFLKQGWLRIKEE